MMLPHGNHTCDHAVHCVESFLCLEVAARESHDYNTMKVPTSRPNTLSPSVSFVTSTALHPRWRL